MTQKHIPLARPTLADVAADAGVSAVTVSRLLNKKGRVSPETRRRITASMEKLGYYRNAAAAQLVSGRNQTIGILTSGISEFGYARTIEGIEKSARAAGFQVLISVVDLGDAGDARAAVAPVASHALAGLIVIDYDSNASPIIEALPPYLPIVTTTGPARAHDRPHPSVFINDVAGSQMAARLLLELGHPTAFVIAPPEFDPDEGRSKGALDAITSARRPVFPPQRAQDWTPESGFKAMDALLDDYGDMVTAVVCANDELALGAVSAVAKRGLRVPEDISIVGFDDNPLSRHSIPPLTTVAQDFVGLGHMAFDALRDLIEGEPVKPSQELVPELVVRESTAPPNPHRGLLLPNHQVAFSPV